MTYMQGQSSRGGHYATSQMVTGLIPNGVIWIFHSHNLFGCVMALVERGCHWNHVCFLWGAAEADETIEHQTYNSVEHNQVAEVLNEINARLVYCKNKEMSSARVGVACAYYGSHMVGTWLLKSKNRNGSFHISMLQLCIFSHRWNSKEYNVNSQLGSLFVPYCDGDNSDIFLSDNIV
jgi:hypothetical protein